MVMKRVQFVFGLVLASLVSVNLQAAPNITQVVEKLPEHVELPEHAMSGYLFAANVHILKSNKIKLPLPDAGDIAVIGRIRTSYPNGSKLWVGNVENDPYSSVHITQHGQAIAGVIRSKGRLFKLQHVEEDKHILMEVPPNEPYPEADPVSADLVSSGENSATNGDVTASSQIDVMVVYSTDTKSRYGGEDGVNAHIALAIAESNQAYANSQIDAQLRLAHTAEVENSSGNMSNDLSALRSTTDGVIDHIHDLRDQYGVDMVSWFNEQGSYCGIAYVNKGDISADAAYGFSVVNSGCATGYFSTAHELGHNMGSMHDEANSGTQGIYPYSYGYQEPSGEFRTVMAYNCPGGCTRQQFFSNPNLAFNGAVIGIADEADNARSLNNTRDAVSQWRPEVVDTPPLASFSYNCILLDCTFTDTSSSSSPLVGWDWSFGDGNVSTSQNTAHSFSQAGQYNVQLTVMDDTGASAFHIETVYVADSTPVPPEQPSISFVSVSGVDVTIDWFEIGDAEAYVLERERQHPKNGKWNGLTIIQGVSSPYVDQPGDGTYRYRLIAQNQYGDSSPSPWILAENVSGGTSGGGKGNNNGKGGGRNK